MNYVYYIEERSIWDNTSKIYLPSIAWYKSFHLFQGFQELRIFSGTLTKKSYATYQDALAYISKRHQSTPRYEKRRGTCLGITDKPQYYLSETRILPL